MYPVSTSAALYVREADIQDREKRPRSPGPNTGPGAPPARESWGERREREMRERGRR
jgi:hypothetical protein